MKNIIIVGASGMVGGHILEYCLGNPQVAQVTSLVRKPTGRQHAKLKELIHGNFLDYSDIASDFEQQDVAFFCIGVYTGAASKEDFRKITVDFPQAFGQMLKEKNEHINFCLLSGQGADRTEKSRMMFARDKGAAENLLDALDLGEFHSFRPGYIYPSEPRTAPNFGYKIYRLLYKPLISRLGKNLSITSKQLAMAMVNVGLHGCEQTILENRDILDYVENERLI